MGGANWDASKLAMKTLATLLGIATAAVVSTSAYTITHYTDIDQITGNNFITGGHNRITGLFDIVTGDGDVNVAISAPYYSTPQVFSDAAGFRPGSETIDAVQVYFYFRDDADDKIEAVRLSLDNYILTRDYDLANLTFSIFGGTASGAIQALERDGQLYYNVIRVDGDFYFDFARLEVDAHVPDGGSTAILLGFGILGLAAVRRKTV